MAKKCPICGGKLIDIVYGMPTHEAFLESERGEICLGGCVVEEYDYHCNKCHMDFTEDLSESHESEE